MPSIPGLRSDGFKRGFFVDLFAISITIPNFSVQKYVCLKV
jgi:hypothetical protein